MEVVTAELSSAVACVRCGYDLRGHDAGGRCPECGLDAYWTLRAPQKLSEYPADWVSAMSRGIQLLAITYAGLFVFILLGFTGWFQNDMMIASVFLIASAFQLAGMWMLSRHSGHLRERAAPVNRWLLRLTPLGLLIGSACAVLIPYHYDPMLEVAMLIGLAIGAIAPTATFIRLRSVARLIADATLAEYSAIVGWGFLAVCAALAVFTSAARGSTLAGVAGLALIAIIGASLLLFLLWGAFILICCVIDFRRAARIAQAQWNPPSPPVSSTDDAGERTARRTSL